MGGTRGGEVSDGRRAGKTPVPKRRARNVYVYFDNDAKVRAPVNALGLVRRVEGIMESLGGIFGRRRPAGSRRYEITDDERVLIAPRRIRSRLSL
jgi:hypothetical protein